MVLRSVPFKGLDALDIMKAPKASGIFFWGTLSLSLRPALGRLFETLWVMNDWLYMPYLPNFPYMYSPIAVIG